MAELAAKTFKELPNSNITRVIASPLLRAQQTAAPTAKAFGVEVESDCRLIEAGNHFEGVAVNKNPKELLKPKYWKYYLNPLRPSWGEAYDEIADRMLKVVRKVLHENSGEQVLLVSHQLPIWCMRAKLENRSLAHLPHQRQCSLASVTTLVFEGGQLADIIYWEPAACLLAEASDMTPGTSKASVNKGR